MRLPVNQYRMASRCLLTALGSAALAGCAASGVEPATTAVPQASGPRADFPVVVGAPYQIDGQTFTPVDVLNYDEVGYLAPSIAMPGYGAAHHTLPMPSYVEVTSLESGRTVLLRIEQRGPMDSTHLLALSPDAMNQLGAAAGAAIRVRRVNPPEEQRAMLRAGQAAPLRMDTPLSLVTVLRRRLPSAPDAPGRAAVSPEEPIATTTQTVPAIETVGLEPSNATETPAPRGTRPDIERQNDFDPAVQTVDAPPRAVPSPAPVAGGEGAFRVQVAAFANPANATRLAETIGGSVIVRGHLHLVQTGPFLTRGEAEASLANVREEGYGDARILTGD